VEGGGGIPTGEGMLQQEWMNGEWCIIEGRWGYNGGCSLVGGDPIHPPWEQPSSGLLKKNLYIYIHGITDFSPVHNFHIHTVYRPKRRIEIT
jgi:hypothetical protein